MSKNIFLLKDKKGQASAPFEVLVAVILMGFVIMAGTWALINLNQNVCIGNTRQKMSELKEAIEDVVLGSDLTVKNINFNIQPCFNKKYEQINVITYSNETKCTAYCQGGKTCTLLEYSFDDNNTKRQPIEPICLNVPTSIESATNQSECGIYSNDQWAVVSLSVSPSPAIRSGRYQLFMKSGINDNVSRVLCFLRRVK